jgi:hypothetical protein
VSQKEIDRNNAIYEDYQHNRNPFVDHPEYANMIWDPTWSIADHQEQNELSVTQVVVYDLTGRKVLEMNVDKEDDNNIVLNNKLKQGCYLLQYTDGTRVIKNKKLLIN